MNRDGMVGFNRNGRSMTLSAITLRSSLFARALSCASAALLVLPLGTAPVAFAQDDDMPDGDVDIVEKPKKQPKKAEPKKSEPKKEEKKPEPKPEPKPEEKPEPKPEKPEKVEKPEAKKEDKKKEEKGSRKPIGSDDDVDDILTVPASAVPPPAAPKTPVVPVEPDASDDLDAPSSDSGRVLVGTDDELPVTPGSRLLDDDAPKKPIVVDSAPVDEPADEGSRAAPVVTAGDPSETTTIDTTVEEPEEPTGSTPWIIAGAAGGGALLLAGAGVGAFFLISALTAAPSGTLTVTPH